MSTTFRRYFDLSRTRTYSILFALPLMLAYEAAVVLINAGDASSVRNAADVLLRRVFLWTGAWGGPAFLIALTAIGIVLVVREQRREPVPLRRQFFFLMLAESVTLALLFGAVVSRATAVVLSPLPFLTGLQAESLSRMDLLVLSLGAGLYEELLFRVLLVGSLWWLLRRWRPDRPKATAAAAVIVSALLFSVFHYVGPYGDAWSLSSFTFRLIGGLVFSAIFVLRGFGIVAWTHALYDVFLLLL